MKLPIVIEDSWVPGFLSKFANANFRSSRKGIWNAVGQPSRNHFFCLIATNLQGNVHTMLEKRRQLAVMCNPQMQESRKICGLQ